MIDFYETPEQQNNIAGLATLICGVSGMGLFLASNYILYPSLAQMVALGLLVVCVMMAARWQTRFRYRIGEDVQDGTIELAVVQLRGKKTTTLCRLSLKDLREIERCTSENRDACKQKYHADKVHNYCRDVLPATSVYLHFEEAGQRIILRLQASEEFISLLEQYR